MTEQTATTLTETELNALKELREKYALSTTQFGQLKIEKRLLQKELDRLNRLEEEFESQYDAIIESEIVLVKQIEEFAKVMSILLGLKRDENYPKLSELISESLKKYTSIEIDYIESLIDEQLIDILTSEKKLNDEQLKILADLLFEKADYYFNSQQNSELKLKGINCYKKSYVIYLFLKEQTTLTYSLDMHYKLEL